MLIHNGLVPTLIQGKQYLCKGLSRYFFCFVISALSPSLQAGFFDSESESNQNTVSAPDAISKKAQMQALLAEIEKRYGATAALLKSLHNKIEQKRRSLSKIHQDMLDYQNEIDRENKELINQVRSAYLMGQQEQLKLMLNQQDPALSSRMMVYYGYLNRERLSRLAAIEKAIEKLDQLDKEKQAETELLEQNLSQKQNEQLLLNKFRKQRADLLAQTDEMLTADDQRLSQLEDNEQKLKDLVESLPRNDLELPAAEHSEPQTATLPIGEQGKEDFSSLQGNFSSFKGKLPWPTKGKIAQNFASLQSEDIQNGVLIEATEGVDVHAVAKGKVAFAEWMQSYGFLIIVDHGEGFMTLYAFNQSLYKHKNDTVEAGEVIASVGQSGGRSQPGLYFGIRKQGSPIDPLEWCRKARYK
ncbi:MAG: peptidoglycan DD-metalloendopeptidase family protein [Methylovulum sp.]|nr:peptidoglycan DD-metalloendopeptidase family protein [Methylovulum sp.]MCF7998916.1 peptidoglycan DD-metalloendopeptidase family protein [Methylovulum sp.]